MRPGLQIRYFWLAESLFLAIAFNQKKQDKTFVFKQLLDLSYSIVVENLD